VADVDALVGEVVVQARAQERGPDRAIPELLIAGMGMTTVVPIVNSRAPSGERGVSAGGAVGEAITCDGNEQT
jgi:hypothetical protein